MVHSSEQYCRNEIICVCVFGRLLRLEDACCADCITDMYLLTFVTSCLAISQTALSITSVLWHRWKLCLVQECAQDLPLRPKHS